MWRGRRGIGGPGIGHGRAARLVDVGDVIALWTGHVCARRCFSAGAIVEARRGPIHFCLCHAGQLIEKGSSEVRARVLHARLLSPRPNRPGLAGPDPCHIRSIQSAIARCFHHGIEQRPIGQTHPGTAIDPASRRVTIAVHDALELFGELLAG